MPYFKGFRGIVKKGYSESTANSYCCKPYKRRKY